MTDNSTPSYAPGWYPDVNAPGTERYYDGTAWTEQTRPQVPAAADLTVEEPPAAKRPWYKRKAIVIPAAVLAALIVIPGVANGLSGNDDTPAPRPPAASQDKDDKPVAEEPETVEMIDLVGMTMTEAKAALDEFGLIMEIPEGEEEFVISSQTPSAGDDSYTLEEVSDMLALASAAPEPEMTVAQESALASAKSYMSSIGDFSRQGLIDQLMYEKFSEADATFAVDAGGFDWMQAAADSAASYMDSIGGFSRGSLIDQLLYEGFTQEQAEHGANSVGL